MVIKKPTNKISAKKKVVKKQKETNKKPAQIKKQATKKVEKKAPAVKKTKAKPKKSLLESKLDEMLSTAPQSADK